MGPLYDLRRRLSSVEYRVISSVCLDSDETAFVTKCSIVPDVSSRMMMHRVRLTSLTWNCRFSVVRPGNGSSRRGGEILLKRAKGSEQAQRRPVPTPPWGDIEDDFVSIALRRPLPDSHVQLTSVSGCLPIKNRRISGFSRPIGWVVEHARASACKTERESSCRSETAWKADGPQEAHLDRRHTLSQDHFFIALLVQLQQPDDLVQSLL